MNTGELHILNTGAGDVTVTFNKHDVAETDRAIRMLKDMQKRGYAIMVRMDDGTYTRAIEVDAERGHYVVMEQELMPVELPAVASTEEEVSAAPPPKRRGRPRRIPVATASAVGIARSAGG